jgi:glyoxylase-like metal-dependent hydrolase (beta-lactamase superfamily II)
MRNLCFIVMLFLGSAHAQPVPTQWRQDFRKVPVAAGIVAYIADDSPGGVVQGNVTLISGRRDSLVIDSGQYPGLARRIVEDIRASGAPPVRYLVNTHWHGDHLMANFVFQQAYPGLTVIQHEETGRVGAKTYADWISKQMPDLKAYPARLDKAAATGKTSKGVVLTQQQRDDFRLDSVQLKHWLATSSDARWIRRT